MNEICQLHISFHERLDREILFFIKNLLFHDEFMPAMIGTIK